MATTKPSHYSILTWVEKYFHFLVFFIALVIRLIPILLFPNLPIGLDDMFQYDMLARSLVAGNGYRWYAQEDLSLIQSYIDLDFSTVDYDSRGVLTSFRPPLYPAFLALVYWLFGVGACRFFIVRIIQAFIGAALVPLTYNLARQIFPEGKKTAQVSAWIIVFYPLLILYPLALATENLFFIFLICSFIAALKAARDKRWYWFLLSGILLGFTALTRSIVLIFAGLVVFWVWFVLRNWKMALVALAAIISITLPWVVRNTLLHHQLTGIETNLGYNLYLGYHPEATGAFQYPQSLDLLPIMDDTQRDEIGRARAWEFIRADPLRAVYLVFYRTGHFFSLERRALTFFYSNGFFGYIPAPLLIFIVLILFLPFVIVMISAALGLAITRFGKEIKLLVLLFIGYISPHLLIISEDRFHLAIVPFFAILAAHCWQSGWRALKLRGKTPIGKITLLFAGITIALLLLNWGYEIWRDADKIVQLFGPNGNQTHFSY